MRRFIPLTAVLLAGLGLVSCSAVAPASSGSEAPTSAPTDNVPEGDGPLVAFYGDSYTLGTGASDLARRWSTQIVEQRGWREFNPSVNGLGFVNNRTSYGEDDFDLPARIIKTDPDIVFVTMGLNDNFSFDRAADRIHEQIGVDFERLKTGLPDARFIVVEPFWYTDERPESVEVIIDWVKQAAADIDADYIPGASHWIEGHPEWMAADGLHPNDEGYAEMAVRMDDELNKLGL